MQRKQYSIETEDACVDLMRRFVPFHSMHHVSRMDSRGVAAFRTHSAVDGKVAASNHNQVTSVLLNA